MEAQAALPYAFYFDTDAFTDGQLRGWCSTWCCQNREEKRVSQLPRCDFCDVFIPSSVITFHDWSDDPNATYCFRCAAAVPGTPQWNDPGRVAFGEAGILLPIPGPPEDIFLAWSTAAFWSMVWKKRSQTPGEARADESETAKRLDTIEDAFQRGDWATGAEQLQPIGNRWLRDGGQSLWAWEPENCRRVAQAWSRLHDYLLSSLPEDIRQILLSRPTSEEEHRVQRYPGADRANEFGEVEGEQARQAEEAHLRQEEAGRRRKENEETWKQLNDLLGKGKSGE